MSENSAISWTDHTFNPWVGCTKVSPACDHCYAERWSKRAGKAAGVVWGGERRLTGEANWRKPLKWNAQAEREGRRYRVFCASLADVFDNQVPAEWRVDLFRLIATTPSLDWLLLTKRIGNAWPMIQDVARRCGGGEQPMENVWLGATICNQGEADRDIPKLLAVPAAKRFLSMEPLLGPVDLGAWIGDESCHVCRTRFYGDEMNRSSVAVKKVDFEDHPEDENDIRKVCPNCETINTCGEVDVVEEEEMGGGLHWVIVGGESGPHARPMHPDWARSLRDQCAAAGVPFHFKQWGEWRPPAAGEQYDTTMGQAQRVPAFIVAPEGTVHCFENDRTSRGGAVMLRVGVTAAGRLLDGVLHDAFPEAA